VAACIWHFDNGQMEDFKGTYSQFLSELEQFGEARSKLA
jgi:ATPase subunit of ABC transporter with duplicated ATPase domains